MLRETLAILVSSLALSVTPCRGQTTQPSHPHPHPARWIPPQAVAVLELRRPAEVQDLLLSAGIVAAVTSLPGYEKLSTEPGFKRFLGVVRYLEIQLGSDWKTALRTLLSGGVTVAVAARDTSLVVIDAENDTILDKLHDAVRGLALLVGGADPAAVRDRSREYRDVTCWRLGDNGEYAILGKRLLIASKPKVLEAVLDLRAAPKSPQLASLPAYRAAQKAAGADLVGTLFVNLALLKQGPGAAKAGAQPVNPFLSFLFAGVVRAFRDSSWLTLGLRVNDSTLAVDASVDARPLDPKDPIAFSCPSAQGEGALPNLSIAPRMAAVTLYRDLHRFYAAKERLFPERSSAIIFFENMMGIFFSGRNLTEEVLAETKPGLRFVVAPQRYDAETGTPTVKIPAFALVLRLKNPEEFGVVAEEAWQKALGFVNFTRGQQGEPGLLIDRQMQGDTKFTLAAFSFAGIKDRTKLDRRFNFRPAIAIQGDSLILSSTDGLARDLIDALRAEAKDSPVPQERTDSLVELDGERIAAALKASRAALVRQNMLEEGNTRQQAEFSTDVLIAVVREVKQVALRLGREDGHPHARLTIRLDRP